MVKDYIEKRKADLDVGLDSKDVLFLSNQRKEYIKNRKIYDTKVPKRANITVKSNTRIHSAGRLPLSY